jgi:hypothetical protein
MQKNVEGLLRMVFSGDLERRGVAREFQSRAVEGVWSKAKNSDVEVEDSNVGPSPTLTRTPSPCRHW